MDSAPERARAAVEGPVRKPLTHTGRGHSAVEQGADRRKQPDSVKGFVSWGKRGRKRKGV